MFSIPRLFSWILTIALRIFWNTDCWEFLEGHAIELRPMMMSFVIIILIFFLAFISEFLGEKIQIISGIHRVRASHWSKLKKLYLASWLMNTSPLELLDSAFVWLRSIVKLKWISRKSVKQKWALFHIFPKYCSIFYLLVSNIKPWTCSGESEKCKKICEL